MTMTSNNAVRPADVVYVSDEQYLIPLSVSLRSLQENTDAASLTVTVLCDGVSPEGKRRVLDSVPCPKALQFVDIRTEMLPKHSGQGVSTRISRTAFALFTITAELVDPTRCVYLDADTVVRVDIRRLLATDLADKALGAVYDRTYTLFDRGTGRLSGAGAAPGRRFNSGVLAIDTRRWFREQIGRRSKAVARAHQIMDQGALNVVCADKWVELDAGWNVTTQQWIMSNEFSAAPERVFIRHLTAVKPWLAARPSEDRVRLSLDEFYEYLARTDWPRGPTRRQG
ncbi:glycosyltransferase family 8 protein [Streptomyces sp. NPDC004752]